MKGQFETGKVSRHIVAQALPLFVAELVHILYNIVDRVYLGRLDNSLALTGVGLVFPIVSIVAAFTSLFSTGGAPLFSIARGAGEKDRASGLMNQVFFLLTTVSLVLTAAILLFREGLLMLFGASADSLPVALEYLNIYILGTPFTMIATGMNPFINAQGYPRMGMVTTLLGAALNLILDPLFIFAMGMGVRGAALATVISQAASCLWVILFLNGKKAEYPLKRSGMRPDGAAVGEILALGFVGFIMKATNSVVQAAANATLQFYGGDLYVGVMTVINSVREVLHLPVLSLTSGAQPVLGYNYGAKRPGRVCEGVRFVTLIAMLYLMAAWMSVLLFPDLIMKVFSRDALLILKGVPALKIYFFGFVCMAFQSAGQSTFQALGDARHAIFFSLLRKVIIVLPLTLLLPRAGLGVDGVFWAEPVSNLLGGVACYVTMRMTVYRKLQKQAASMA